MIPWLKPYGIFLLMAGLAACGGAMAPVRDLSVGARHPETEYREVFAGDTLYSIAWESGRDYRDLAAWNHISPPYVIKPGQRLRLYPPDGAFMPYRTTQKTSPPATSPRVAAPRTTNLGKPSSEKSETVPAARAPAASSPISWTWPAEGELLERYVANGRNKGIDIASKQGQPVSAAAAGQVVYQGGGLRGYGQLIIIKHNADLLSAYAHCDKIYVKEGNVIKRGQKIADMGSSGADRVKLHFEIRYRGAPMYPQDYLPRK